MKTPSEYRAQAREVLQNNWGEAAIVSAIIIIIACVLSTPSFIGSMKFSTEGTMSTSSITTFLTILVIPIQYAMYIALLEWTRGKEEGLLQATVQHSSKNYGKLLVAALLITILTSLLGAVTFGIGAIILGYAYRMVPYLLHDYPELSAREALKISRQMMKGKKWDLFVLDLSFIGWALLSIITLGIGTLFLIPYVHTSEAFFYEDLKQATIVEETE